MDNREIAELIVKKINGTKNNYDAIDETIKVLDKQLTKRKSTVPSAPQNTANKAI
jgi:ribosome-associated translation inhibitor RaiA